MEKRVSQGKDAAQLDGRSQTPHAIPPPRSPSPPTPKAHIVQVRQLNVIIGSDPIGTISSLSSALFTAQGSVSMLGQSNSQLQLASASAVASVQSLAQLSISAAVASVSLSAAAALTSASSAVASVSQSAAAALTSASSAVAQANAMAAEASRSADAARADSTLLRAQPDALQATQTMGMTGFSMTHVVVAVIISIIGTSILSVVGFVMLNRYRYRQEVKRINKLMADIKPPDTSSSTGSGAAVWSNGFAKLKATVTEMRVRNQYTDKTVEQHTLGTPAAPEQPDISGVERGPDWPLSSIGSHMSVEPDRTINQERVLDEESSPGPLTSNSSSDESVHVPEARSSTMPGLSLFPKDV